MLNAERNPLAGATDIQVRTRAYALRAVRLYRYLEKKRDDVGLILGKQYLRAATSIGANMVEAQSGESRRDFIHKCSICQKEARECGYWLTLLLEAQVVSQKRLGALIDETNQLIAILTKIIVNAKKSAGT